MSPSMQRRALSVNWPMSACGPEFLCFGKTQDHTLRVKNGGSHGRAINRPSGGHQQRSSATAAGANPTSPPPIPAWRAWRGLGDGRRAIARAHWLRWRRRRCQLQHDTADEQRHTRANTGPHSDPIARASTKAGPRTSTSTSAGTHLLSRRHGERPERRQDGHAAGQRR
jgi:hypothetical protein